MAQQEKRNPQKRPKDEKQGMAILNVVAHSMPQFPLGSAFEIELPDELVPHFARWKEQYVAPPRPRW
jgi:hypothetical protein